MTDKTHSQHIWDGFMNQISQVTTNTDLADDKKHSQIVNNGTIEKIPSYHHWHRWALSLAKPKLCDQGTPQGHPFL